MRPERRSAGEQRLRALRQAMAQAGAELVIIYGSGLHDLTRSNWCWYFSGLKQLGRDACLCVTTDGQALLIVTPKWDEERSRRDSWIAEVLATDSLPAALATQLAARGWSNMRALVIDFGRAPTTTSSSVSAMFPNFLGDGTPVVPRTYDEYGKGLIAGAVAIAEATYEKLLAYVTPGMRDFELAAYCDKVMSEAGSDANFLVVCASQHHLGPSPPVGRIVEQGDVVLAELSPSLDGQFAQICRTFVIGDTRPALVRNHWILDEAFNAALAACRPGVEVAEVTRAANRVIERHGFGAYNAPQYTRARGHAVGLGPMVPPVIAEQLTMQLEPGMSFVLHPNQYFPDSGYLFYGDQVFVESHGASRLPKRPGTLEVILARATA